MNPQKAWSGINLFFHIQVMAILYLKKKFKDNLNMDILIGCIILVCIIPDYIVVSYMAV